MTDGAPGAGLIFNHILDYIEPCGRLGFIKNYVSGKAYQ